MEHAALLDEVGRESRRHYAAYVLFNQALAERLALHPTDLQCLSLMALESAPPTVGEIAALTGLSQSAATRLVDRLERAGIARRVPVSGDRRRTHIELTDPGREAVERAWEEPGAAFSTLLESFDSAQLQTILDYLRRAGTVGQQQADRLRSSASVGITDDLAKPPSAARARV